MNQILPVVVVTNPSALYSFKKQHLVSPSSNKVNSGSENKLTWPVNFLSSGNFHHEISLLPSFAIAIHVCFASIWEMAVSLTFI